MKYEVLAQVDVEGLKLPSALELGRMTVSANPEGRSPLRAKAMYEDVDWKKEADRDLRGVAAALGIEWSISARVQIVDAVQIFPDGRRAQLSHSLGPLRTRVTDTALDPSGHGNAIAELVAGADDDLTQLIDFYLWGLRTEQQAQEANLAVIPYSMVLDGLSTGKGTAEARWSRLIDRLERHGYPEGPSAKLLVRARNAWVKHRNYGSDTGEVDIGHFRELARYGLRARLQGTAESV